MQDETITTRTSIYMTRRVALKMILACLLTMVIGPNIITITQNLTITGRIKA